MRTKTGTHFQELDDPLDRLVAAVIYHAVQDKDNDFLASDWCAWLLEHLQIDRSYLLNNAHRIT
jgi:hypothetical protein